jgi:methionyl-tRNA formyltransferase
MRIVLFGDGRWATDSMARLAKDGHDLVGVVARSVSFDSAFLEAVIRLGLPVSQPEKVNSKESMNWVAGLRPDLCLSIAYNQILKQPVLDIPVHGFVNFHAGKLPNYRGRNIINWAIINGETEVGLTSHYIDEGIDTGDIILQRSLPIGWTDTYGDVLGGVIEAIPGLVAETVSLVASGKADRKPQSHLPGTYFGGRGPGDEWLDWSDTSYNLHNKVRAITHPGPGATALLDGNIVIIWKAFYDVAWPKYIATPGQVVGRRAGEGTVVKTGDSTLLVQEVQFPDGESHSPDWPIGTRLEIDVQERLDSMQSQIKDLKRRLNGADKPPPKARV